MRRRGRPAPAAISFLEGTNIHGIRSRTTWPPTISLANFAKATDLKKRLWFTLGALIVFRLLSFVPLPGIDPRALSHAVPADPGRRARFLQHVLGRRPRADEPDRARRDALHHRLDRHAARDLDVADARRAQEGRRERAQEDQPIYPLRHRLPVRDPGLFHGRRPRKLGRGAGPVGGGRSRACCSASPP